LLLLAAWWLPASAAFGAALSVGDQREYPLDWHFTTFVDESGAYALDDARKAYDAGRFRAPPSSTPGFGYVKGALWVHFTLNNALPRVNERWLESDWPYQQEATLFLIADDGQVNVFRNGSLISVKDRPLHSRQILFPVTLPPQKTVEGYLRLSGRSAVIVSLTLWEPAAYADHGRRFMALRYLMLAALMVFMAVSLIAWQTFRRPGLILGAVSHGLLILLIFSADGHLFDTLLPAGAHLWQSRLGIFLAYMIIATHMIFTVDFLDVRKRHPRLFPALAAMIGLSIALALLLSASPMLMPAVIAHQTLILAMIVIAIYMSFTGSRHARAYLLAWSMMWLFFGLRGFGMMGYIPSLPFMPNLPILGLALSSLTLSYALFADIKRTRDELVLSQTALLQQQAEHQQRLEQAVEARTHELDIARQRAEESSQTKSAFVSMINHELRGPLHTILGYTNLLSKEIPAHLLHRMRIVENSGKQLLRLIEDLLSFSSGEAGATRLVMEAVDLRELSQEILEPFQTVAARNGNFLSCELAPGLPVSVETDGQRLAQVLQNLVGNACKFTQHGKITLKIELVPEASLSGLVAVRFSVEDNGIGIEPEAMGHIFDVFVRGQGSQRQPGVGLGLPIARQLVRALGGEIEAYSSLGLGTRFIFTLKLRPLDGAPARKSSPRGIIGYHGAPKTLLIVDDVRENRELLRALCLRWKFTPLLAEDGRSAIALFNEHADSISGILVDQFMPELDGWDFLRAVGAETMRRKIPVILVSAAPPQRPKDFPAELEFDALLMKPISPDDLAEVIASCLDIDWIYKPATAAPNSADPLVYPPERELEALRTELAYGRVVAIKRRLEEILKAQPECLAFVREALQASQALDLKRLEKLFSAPESS
jgi:signal transduction histidine kinase/DNA-binding NarL/FixJ family response regulator